MSTDLRLLPLLFLFIAASSSHAQLFNSTLFFDNGDVCKTLHDTVDLPPTTCVATALSGTLNSVLAACAGDTNAIITLEFGFEESLSMILPDIASIQLIGDGQAHIIGSQHVVLGNRTQLYFANITFDGQGTTNMLFDPPLRSNNVTLIDVIALEFHGFFMILQEGCENDVTLTVLDSFFFDVWGAALFHSGLNSFDVESNIFSRCGGNGFSCVFLKHHWATLATSILFNNSQWVLYDEQPPVCIQNIDPPGHVRCNQGIIECEDITTTTILGDCPTQTVTYQSLIDNSTVTEQVFSPFCRRYKPCVCEDVYFHDSLNVSVTDIVLAVGDIIYPSIILQCVPGGPLFAGNDFVGFGNINITDPSLETGNSGGIWTTFGSPIRSIVDDNTGPPPRTGNERMLCAQGQDRWIEQPIYLSDITSYQLAFWGATGPHERKHFDGAILELFLNGTLVGNITNPTFHDTLVQENVYFQFMFPAFSPPVANSTYILTIRCDFGGDSGSDTILAIDDFFNITTTLTLDSFPPGLGLGPPVGSDPSNYIALPLTTNATIALNFTCAACPPVPNVPTDVPCDYTIATGFSCEYTIHNGVAVCVIPTIEPLGFGLGFTDPSLELVATSSTWAENPPANQTVVLASSVPWSVSAYDGSWLMWCRAGVDSTLEQTISVANTASYTIQFYALMPYPESTALLGKIIRLLVDAVPVDTISGTTLSIDLFAVGLWTQFSFNSVVLTAGTHTITFDCDMQGGFFSADLLVDEIQFFGANLPATPTPTPSTTPSASPTPSMSPSNITSNSTSNSTVSSPSFPSDELRCVNQVVYLGNNPVTSGCLIFDQGEYFNTTDGNVTAQECFNDPTCVLPLSWNITVNGFTIYCVDSSMGFMLCDCSSGTLLQTVLNRTITPDTCGYELDETPADITNIFISANRAQQLDWGMCTRRTTYDTVVASSLVTPDWFDEKGVGREVTKQNPLLWGLIPQGGNTPPVGAPRFLMDALPEYEQICEYGCPVFNPDNPQSIQICSVDNAASDLQGPPTNYPTIQSAIDAGCNWLNIRASENFYEEDIEFNRRFTFLFATTPNVNTTIVGAHTIVSNAEFFFARGLSWIHSGKNGVPLFDFSGASDLANFTLYNNYFSGAGVKDASVINNKNRRIADVDVRYNMVTDFLTTALRFNADNVIASHNQFVKNSGRMLQVNYRQTFFVEHNVFIDSRGADDIEKPAIIELYYIGQRGSEQCSTVDACQLRNNVQMVTDVTEAPDYQEVGILLVKGAVHARNIRDNVVIKARTGLRLRDVNVLIDPDELTQATGSFGPLELFQFYNPWIRPSRTRVRSGGEDFMIDGYFNGRRFARFRCSFPECTAPENQPKRCIADLNFEALQSHQFGWETYTNTTTASFFCALPLVEVMVFGGARIIPERFNISRPNGNAIFFPLQDGTTVKDIIDGRAPVPNRFTVRGVGTTNADALKFAALLDRNTT